MTASDFDPETIKPLIHQIEDQRLERVFFGFWLSPSVTGLCQNLLIDLNRQGSGFLEA